MHLYDQQMRSGPGDGPDLYRGAEYKHSKKLYYTVFFMYNRIMVEIRIEKNDAGKRLDRFLRKYYPNASLSHIYKMIRKDVKINGVRGREDSILSEGDELRIYIDESESRRLAEKTKRITAKKRFAVAYEDEDCLIVEKPFGLLTHGDGKEKKNTLANQVLGYLIEKGDYVPDRENTFVPAPANRLDRNTTGLVIFGKTSSALKEFNSLLKERDGVEKYYMTILHGRLDSDMELVNMVLKDDGKNMVTVYEEDSEEGSGGKLAKMLVRPLSWGEHEGEQYTLAEIRLFTGRTHQIRAQMANAGHPLVGDRKYGNDKSNARLEKEWGLSTQLLHGYKLRFTKGIMEGKVITASMPKRFKAVSKEIFKGNLIDGKF